MTPPATRPWWPRASASFYQRFLHRRREALRRLEELQHESSPQDAHEEADEVLLELIDDTQVREAYEKIEKWYA